MRTANPRSRAARPMPRKLGVHQRFSASQNNEQYLHFGKIVQQSFVVGQGQGTPLQPSIVVAKEAIEIALVRKLEHHRMQNASPADQVLCVAMVGHPATSIDQVSVSVRFIAGASPRSSSPGIDRLAKWRSHIVPEEDPAFSQAQRVKRHRADKSRPERQERAPPNTIEQGPTVQRGGP